MSQEDIVQFQDVKYVDFTFVDDALVINHEAGFGVLTSIAEGVLNLALDSNPSAVPARLGSYKAPIPPKLLKVNLTHKGLVAGTAAAAQIDMANTTPTNIRINLYSSAAELANIDGSLLFSQCENITQASK